MSPETRKRIFAGVSGLILLFTLVMLPPWRVGMPSNTLDPSWAMVIQHAFSKGWQFGEDIIFTYGPLGFIMVPQYQEGLYAPALVYWLALYTTLALALCFLYRTAPPTLLLILALAIVVLPLNWAHDGAWFAACFIVFLLTDKTERTASFLAVGLTVLLAAAALMKTTSLLLTLPTVILCDLFRHRRPDATPVLTATFVASFVGFYLIAGQSLRELGTYLVTALEVARGYGEAMQIYGSIREIALFGLAASGFFAVVAVREFRRNRIEAMYHLAMAAGFLFVAAKAGFVRHDVGHAMIPWVALMLAATAYIGALSNERNRFFSAAVAAIMIGSTSMVCTTYMSGARETGRAKAGAEIVPSDLVAQARDDAAALANVIFGDQMARYRAAYAQQMKNIRAQVPLPPLGDTVDLFGVTQAVALASAAEYRPRPVFQSYSVYTRELIERNRRYITGERAPDTILLAIQSVDGRHPALDEGALWPDLLRHYDVTHFESGYAVMRRRNVSRAVEFQDLHQTSIAFAETLDVSEWAVGGLLWVEMDFRPSLLGRIRSVLFKPPLLMMTVTTDAGNTQTFRIVPGMTGSGFLLSPLVEAADQFAQLPAREESVVRFSIAAVGRPAGMFEPNFGIRLRRLHIAGDRELPAHLDMDV
ncbi:MAG: hypothetical protein AB7P20_26700, partial [Rhizobiaceae bacterium]